MTNEEIIEFLEKKLIQHLRLTMNMQESKEFALKELFKTYPELLLKHDLFKD